MHPPPRSHSGRSRSATEESKSPVLSVIFPLSPEWSDVLSGVISEALQLLKDRQNCCLKKSWNAIQLKLDDYDTLQRQLETNEEELLAYVKITFGMMKATIKFIQLAARSVDHDPNNCEYVVRMPTVVHGLLLASMQNEISRQLDVIQADEDHASILAKNTLCFSSSEVLLENGALRCPDLEFRHADCQYPRLIVEVANSQTKKDKRKKSRETSRSIRGGI
ncbi:MAG: hypothetical protein MMC33_000296 [Icmadophila ericetorum]|nr:hypothetical protein [Icmadophila ericetorum]